MGKKPLLTKQSNLFHLLLENINFKVQALKAARFVKDK
jgi:hypothetical protein